MDLYFFILTLPFAGVFYYATRMYPREARYERVQHRDSLTPDEFYDQFYRDSGMTREAVAEVLQFMSAHLHMPVEKLRPDDRFDRELAPIKELEVLSSDLDDFSEDTFQKLKGGAERKHVDLERLFEQTQTIDDYIRMFISIGINR